MFQYKAALRSATHPANIPEWFKKLALFSCNGVTKVSNWQSLWFPTFESFLFRPKENIFRRLKGYEVTKRFVHSLAESPMSNKNLSTQTPSIGVVAVHFREGDVARTDRGRLPMEHVLALVKQLKRASVYSHVFLIVATNNAKLRHKVQRFHATGVTAIALVHSNEAPLDAGTLEKQLAESGDAKQAYAATLSVIQDVDVMSSASYFVGACYSQVSRLAFELMLAKRHAQLPPVSADWEDCRDASYHPYFMTIPWWPRFDTWIS